MKKFFLTLFIIVLISAVGFYLLVYPRLVIVSGYTAKNMCSCVFVAGIDEQKVKDEDLNFDILPYADIKVDYQNKTVSSTVFGMSKKTAVYREHTGCALVNKLPVGSVVRYSKTWPIHPYDSLMHWYDFVDTVDYLSARQSKEMDKSISMAFEEDDPSEPKKNTRAVVVVYKGQLVGEQYAPGFDKDSKLLGWSMTKSLTAAFFGKMESDGLIDHTRKTGIEEWQNDDRRVITWDHLLHMNSGLRWKERYDQVSDAVTMLFNSDGIGEYAMGMPLQYAPNAHWEYSSGTTNIIATELEKYFKSRDEYLLYPYQRIFWPIGMYSLIIETDSKGYFVGSSYSWATARDWAKCGQLFLQNGQWAGQQILPKKWVDYVQKPAPNSAYRYGAHFWLNKDGNLPDVPRDTYSFQGFQGQGVYILPSENLVVVRLGLTYHEPDFDFNAWLSAIIKTIHNN